MVVKSEIKFKNFFCSKRNHRVFLTIYKTIIKRVLQYCLKQYNTHSLDELRCCYDVFSFFRFFFNSLKRLVTHAYKYLYCLFIF